MNDFIQLPRAGNLGNVARERERALSYASSQSTSFYAAEGTYKNEKRNLRCFFLTSRNCVGRVIRDIDALIDCS